MGVIQLDRRFLEWSEGDIEDYRLRAEWGLSDGLLRWAELLARRRVVLLAEAGSGKTTELTEQTRLLLGSGKAAFYATVQEVGRNGLDAALRLKDRTRLKAWREGTDSAWFFIDSIDEAKLDNVRLEQALRRLADAIAGCEARAHVVLSGRHTDWEFQRDARRFGEELPIPEPTDVDTPPLETLVRRLLHLESIPEPEPPEANLIVVMAPLNDRQMRAYATGKGVPNVDALIAAIDKANLHNLARRPLDLDWIVRLWMAQGRLGSFTEMIEASLQERLSEADPVRARRDELEATRAMNGLERVGAALVFGRRVTIAIPDGDETSRDGEALPTLDSVLSDWTGAKRSLLLSRPAFDPATFGRARLHNDNEGVVRAFLAARWLQRLRGANLPSRRLRELLFARKYEIDLVRPSMLECAAWLSGWNEQVAAEVVRRAPHLLFTAGDPSSLAPSTRRAALRALVERLSKGEELPSLDFSSVKRFAQPDIAPSLSELWKGHQDHEEMRTLVLRLIWAGELSDCADIAVQASFGRHPDLYTAVLAGRALLATAGEPVRRKYADYIKAHSGEISSTEVWEAVDSLFPHVIGVDDFLAIVDTVHVGAEGSGHELEWKGKEWVRRLTDAADLTRLVDGLLRHLTSTKSEPASPARTRRSEQCESALAAGAKYLLEMSPADQAPQAAVDAVLHLGQRRLERSEPDGEDLAAAVDLIHRTLERRRAAFWRAASKFSTHPFLNGASLDQVHQMRHLGWPPGLVEEDVDWLLADGVVRKEPSERRLAVNAALHIWWNLERPEPLLARIAKGAKADAEMHAAFAEGTRPYVKSEREVQMDQQYAQRIEEGQRVQQERVQSWITFIQDMRVNPDQLRHPRVAEAGVDQRIYDLWQLLNQANRKSSRHAISSLAPIVEIAGQDVADAFADGLSIVWRAWRPTLRSEREPEKRNLLSSADLVGVAGVSIEAATRPDWAQKLTADDAIRAAQYATLEINGFPDWLSALSAAWPGQVAKVLEQEVHSDLDDPTPRSHYQSLDDIGRASDALSDSMASVLWRELQSRANLSHFALRRMLPVLVVGLLADQREAFHDLVIERFRCSADPQIAADYLGAAYAIDIHGATDALLQKLDSLQDAEKKSLVERVLPQIFGSRWYLSAPPKTITLDLQTLERLVVLAYREVRVADDRDRANQGAIPGFPLSRSRLQALAHGRAAVDSESPAWAPGEPLRFEQEFERPPSTGAELLVVAVGRLEDLQGDLVEGDFQQGSTLSALPDEAEVQKWLADRLRQVQGTAYSIEREVRVAGEKEPDIRFRAKVSDANVATEIKVAESWTVEDLESALVKQLCGQYLRARDGRHGILLIVHQVPRPKGWRLPDGTFVGFEVIVQRLRDLAASIRKASTEGPQPEVCVIDVSGCHNALAPKKRPKAPPKSKTAGRVRTAS